MKSSVSSLFFVTIVVILIILVSAARGVAAALQIFVCASGALSVKPNDVVSGTTEIRITYSTGCRSITVDGGSQGLAPLKIIPGSSVEYVPNITIRDASFSSLAAADSAAILLDPTGTSRTSEFASGVHLENLDMTVATVGSTSTSPHGLFSTGSSWETGIFVARNCHVRFDLSPTAPLSNAMSAQFSVVHLGRQFITLDTLEIVDCSIDVQGVSNQEANEPLRVAVVSTFGRILCNDGDGSIRIENNTLTACHIKNCTAWGGIEFAVLQFAQVIQTLATIPAPPALFLVSGNIINSGGGGGGVAASGYFTRRLSIVRCTSVGPNDGVTAALVRIQRNEIHVPRIQCVTELYEYLRTKTDLAVNIIQVPLASFSTYIFSANNISIGGDSVPKFCWKIQVAGSYINTMVSSTSAASSSSLVTMSILQNSVAVSHEDMAGGSTSRTPDVPQAALVTVFFTEKVLEVSSMVADDNLLAVTALLTARVSKNPLWNYHILCLTNRIRGAGGTLAVTRNRIDVVSIENLHKALFILFYLGGVGVKDEDDRGGLESARMSRNVITARSFQLATNDLGGFLGLEMFRASVAYSWTARVSTLVNNIVIIGGEQGRFDGALTVELFTIGNSRDSPFAVGSEREYEIRGNRIDFDSKTQQLVCSRGIFEIFGNGPDLHGASFVAADNSIAVDMAVSSAGSMYLLVFRLKGWRDPRGSGGGAVSNSIMVISNNTVAISRGVTVDAMTVSMIDTSGASLIRGSSFDIVHNSIILISAPVVMSKGLSLSMLVLNGLLIVDRANFSENRVAIAADTSTKKAGFKMMMFKITGFDNWAPSQPNSTFSFLSNIVEVSGAISTEQYIELSIFSMDGADGDADSGTLRIAGNTMLFTNSVFGYPARIFIMSGTVGSTELMIAHFLVTNNSIVFSSTRSSLRTDTAVIVMIVLEGAYVQYSNVSQNKIVHHGEIEVLSASPSEPETRSILHVTRTGSFTFLVVEENSIEIYGGLRSANDVSISIVHLESFVPTPSTATTSSTVDFSRNSVVVHGASEVASSSKNQLSDVNLFFLPAGGANTQIVGMGSMHFVGNSLSLSNGSTAFNSGIIFIGDSQFSSCGPLNISHNTVVIHNFTESKTMSYVVRMRGRTYFDDGPIRIEHNYFDYSGVFSNISTSPSHAGIAVIPYSTLNLPAAPLVFRSNHLRVAVSLASHTVYTKMYMFSLLELFNVDQMTVYDLHVADSSLILRFVTPKPSFLVVPALVYVSALDVYGFYLRVRRISIRNVSVSTFSSSSIIRAWAQAVRFRPTFLDLGSNPQEDSVEITDSAVMAQSTNAAALPAVSVVLSEKVIMGRWRVAGSSARAVVKGAEGAFQDCAASAVRFGTKSDDIISDPRLSLSIEDTHVAVEGTRCICRDAAACNLLRFEEFALLPSSTSRTISISNSSLDISSSVFFSPDALPAFVSISGKAGAASNNVSLAVSFRDCSISSLLSQRIINVTHDGIFTTSQSDLRHALAGAVLDFGCGNSWGRAAEQQVRELYYQRGASTVIVRCSSRSTSRSLTPVPTRSRTFSRTLGRTTQSAALSETEPLPITRTVSLQPSGSLSTTPSGVPSLSRSRSGPSASLSNASSSRTTEPSDSSSATVSRTRSRPYRPDDGLLSAQLVMAAEGVSVAASLLAGAPTAAMSLSRGLGALELVGCPRFHPPTGRQWISVEPSFTVTPGLSLGDADSGGFYRMSVVSYLGVVVLALCVSLVAGDPTPIPDVSGGDGDDDVDNNNGKKSKKTSSESAAAGLKRGARAPHFIFLFLLPFTGAWASAAGTLATAGGMDGVLATVPLLLFLALLVDVGRRLFAGVSKQWVRAKWRCEYHLAPSYVVRKDGGTGADAGKVQIVAERLLKSTVGRWLLVGDVTWQRDGHVATAKAAAASSSSSSSPTSSSSPANNKSSSSLVVTHGRAFNKLIGPCRGAGSGAEIDSSLRLQLASFYVLISVLVTVLVGFLVGVSKGLGNPHQLCSIAVGLSAVLSCVMCALALWLRPFIVQSRNLLIIIIELCIAVSSSIIFAVNDATLRKGGGAVDPQFAPAVFAAQLIIVVGAAGASSIMSVLKVVQLSLRILSKTVVVPHDLYMREWAMLRTARLIEMSEQAAWAPDAAVVPMDDGDDEMMLAPHHFRPSAAASSTSPHHDLFQQQHHDALDDDLLGTASDFLTPRAAATAAAVSGSSPSPTPKRKSAKKRKLVDI